VKTILHVVEITAQPTDVYRSVTTGEGLAGWWTLAVWERGHSTCCCPRKSRSPAVLLCAAPAAGVATAVPRFEALMQVQDKLAAFRTLTELGLPQPAATVARTADELTAWPQLPVFVKTPIGTAMSGVRRVGSYADSSEELTPLKPRSP
jgi:hypothetical protein